MNFGNVYVKNHKKKMASNNKQSRFVQFDKKRWYLI